jgi:hypothetical protein
VQPPRKAGKIRACCPWCQERLNCAGVENILGRLHHGFSRGDRR